MCLVAAAGTVLDVACGAGRHLAHGHGLGRRMTGVDRDLSRLAIGDIRRHVELIEADLEDGRPWPLAGRTFDGLIVTNYLWRPLLPAIVGSVAPGGVLIYETFAHGHERFGRPRNPEFLLRPGELLDVVRPALMVVAYEHVRLAAPDRIVQRITAVGPAHGHAEACREPDAATDRR
jgi:SAM-dependent methyltransferase